MKTYLIIPAKKRPLLLEKAIISLFNSDNPPDFVYVVIDDCKQTHDHLVSIDLQPYPVYIMENPESIGFWRSINRIISKMENNDLFFYFGQDVEFMPNWYTEAMKCYNENFNNGVGLMSFRDDIQNHGNASHGATTKKTLSIVFGSLLFPEVYDHHFLDSELSVKCSDLGIRFYTHDSHVKHHHDPILGHVDHKSTKDYHTKESRMNEWYNNGLDISKKRLEGAR